MTTKSPDSIGSVPDRQTASGEQIRPFLPTPPAPPGPCRGRLRRGAIRRLRAHRRRRGSGPRSRVEPPEPSLEQRLAEPEGKQKEPYDRYLRSVAELDNFRKRTRKEIEDARIDAQGRVLREMLPVVDNLERALAAAGGNDASDGHGIIEGVRLVLRQFAQALERCGSTTADAQGAAFDRTQHEAVSQLETDTAPPGPWSACAERLSHRRQAAAPGLVVVAKAPPASAGANQAGEPSVGAMVGRARWTMARRWRRRDGDQDDAGSAGQWPRSEDA